MTWRRSGRPSREGPPRTTAWGRRLLALVRWARRQPLPSATVTVWAVAVVLSFIAFGTSGTVYDTGVLGWGVMPFVGALVGLPFGLVVARPFTGWAISATTAGALALVLPRLPGTPWPWLVVHGLVMFALLFGVGVRGDWRLTAGAWLGTAALYAYGVPLEQAPGWTVAVTTVALVGVLAGRLAAARTALARQARVTADEKARRTVLEERARIARDLHDIVAHHMSLIVVQAETAAFRRPDLSAGAREELDAISTAAREALTETRALLSVLRREDEQAAYAPQPGVEQVEELCRTARRAGVPVEWHVDVPGEGVRRALSLAAYRIVQEALANAARHAGGAAVTVAVTHDRERLRVAVENAAPADGVPAPREEAPGHGIVGMREHARAEGGTLDAGATASGGYRVEAVLPLAPVPAGGAA